MRTWWNRNSDVVWILTAIVLMFAVLIGCTLSMFIVSEKGYCNTQTELSTSFEFKWVFWGGCMVQLPDGSWAHAMDYMDMMRFEGKLKE